MSNIAFGNNWSDGLAGAIAGGAVYNAVAVFSKGNTAAASYTAAATESVFNELSDYITGEKDFNRESFVGSIKKVAEDTAVNGTLYYSTGKQAEAIVHVNYKSWFKPTKIASCFTGNYAKKMTLQTMTQAVLTTVEKRMMRCVREAGV